MIRTTLGDMAQQFMLRRQNYTLQTEYSRRITELSTGEVADVSSHLSGDFTAISGIQRSLTLNESYGSVLSSAKTFIDAQLLAFQKARSHTLETGYALVEAAESVDQTRRESVLAESRTNFDFIISSLNSQVAGRSLFSGSDTQTSSYASPKDILLAFSSEVSGLTTADEIVAAADVWFAPGGGYDTQAYTGSLVPLDGFASSQTDVVAPTLSGDHDNLRELVKLHVLSAAMADGSTPLIEAEKSVLFKVVGERMVNLDRNLVVTESQIGGLQKHVDNLLAQNSAEKYSLLTARKDLIGVDTSETVMRLTEVEAQLQSLYVVTAKVSRLSLTEYL